MTFLLQKRLVQEVTKLSSILPDVFMKELAVLFKQR